MVDAVEQTSEDQVQPEPVDPNDASELIEGLTRLETVLKAEGVSLVGLLTKLAHNVEGIRL